MAYTDLLFAFLIVAAAIAAVLVRRIVVAMQGLGVFLRLRKVLYWLGAFALAASAVIAAGPPPVGSLLAGAYQVSAVFRFVWNYVWVVFLMALLALIYADRVVKFWLKSH